MTYVCCECKQGADRLFEHDEGYICSECAKEIVKPKDPNPEEPPEETGELEPLTLSGNHPVYANCVYRVWHHASRKYLEEEEAFLMPNGRMFFNGKLLEYTEYRVEWGE